MSANDDLFAALATVCDESRIFDLVMPEEGEPQPNGQPWALADGPCVTFQALPSIPDMFIEGNIEGYTTTWQVSVRATDLAAARALALQVRTALHGLESTTIKRCELDNAPGEIYESESLPPQFHIPQDFLIFE